MRKKYIPVEVTVVKFDARSSLLLSLSNTYVNPENALSRKVQWDYEDEPVNTRMDYSVWDVDEDTESE